MLPAPGIPASVNLPSICVHAKYYSFVNIFIRFNAINRRLIPSHVEAVE